MSRSLVTLEQLEEALARRLPSERGSPGDLLSRIADSGLIVRIPKTLDLVLSTYNQTIFIQFKHHKRLALSTADFSVQYAYEGSELSLHVNRVLTHPSPQSLTQEDLRQLAGSCSYDRMVRAVRELSDELPNDAMRKVTGAATDTQALMEALWFSFATQNRTSPIRAAKLRGTVVRHQMLELAGGTLSSEEVARILNISRQAVHKRQAAKRLFAVVDGKRRKLFPSFQFSADSRPLRGLKGVLHHLSAVDPWMQLSFFVSASGYLGNKTPIEVLQEGDFNQVIHLASTFGDQGAR